MLRFKGVAASCLIISRSNEGAQSPKSDSFVLITSYLKKGDPRLCLESRAGWPTVPSSVPPD